ncbi:MAG: SDR family NAD(P)-dependent oxidoreductase [Bdellovibrionales bacterium]|nr:SDR family NAD(P)-dependent oxidoreductase [Bdellovibrionales bacterium]
MAKQNVALITGASAGIGFATALRLANEGYSLILCARRKDRLEKLKSECEALNAEDVFAVELDVTDKAAVAEFFKRPDLQPQFKSLTVLVNNAGLASGVDPMDKADVDDWDLMLETNVMGLLYMTRGAIDFLKQNRGHIVNLGSVAGIWTYPGGGVYCATKAAVRSLTEGLRLDLQGTGVRVTNIEPGKVATEFSLVRYQDAERARREYEGYQALTPEDVAECISWSLSRPSHVNIQEMVIYPTAQASVTHLVRSP